MVAEEMDKLLEANADNKQVHQYLDIVKKWESAGVVDRPMTPVRDDTVVLPNHSPSMMYYFK